MSTVVISAPASKSVSHRLLICAALAEGQSRVTGVLESQDLERTRACLSAMGAGIEGKGGDYAVTGVAGAPRGGAAEPAVLDVGESGTTCRLIVAVAAAGQGLFTVSGRGRMHDRPIGELTRVLEGLGAAIAFPGKPDCPPLAITASGLSEGEVEITLEESSQYLSGLLLASPLAAGPLTILVTGTKAVSWPYVAVTLTAMRDCGVPVTVETKCGDAWVVTDPAAITKAEPGRLRFLCRPGRYQPGARRVEGDWSNASYFLAAGALGARPVQVVNLRRDSAQGDTAMVDILGRMGARLTQDADSVTVFPSPLSGVTVDMGHCPDLVPTIAATAAMAVGATTIRNVAHLRIKESDRLAALADNLTRAGARALVMPDGLRIEPGLIPPQDTVSFATYDDHRMAMSMALFGLRGVTARFDNPGCVAKSFPHFFDEWSKVTG
ncbi:3-phosphoshikimate 1-carboxyvinyltransferase [Desulfovibrio sulfodismutans]|uniref:3-phosphoshikimate 1-carboxyvinyltransferase n=1 Tax=Desulfolutivibrio sulfodismutans TaxID=63561 RepID=A0A7K3NS82_9BACT|nr:3-phosphoshikimate 1-carboxyvinyltransferase [Desulfolutivibrio sulfodismutans]NDY58069.1 3-phosphoshikimate 1-carboxyvinyltransferase [Desulfolutivibrio sulfodismutans]QLA13639.1 3-phosphoshikimate 1-carboxyvinyltransferase [Desulfolutivibrio sulfodismutans DSM 3696]